MKIINLTGSKGPKIELRAYCTTTLKDRIVDLDGDRIKSGKRIDRDANLELWIDGKKIDSCWNINFWRLIDAGKGIKKIWGLPVGMNDTQAVIVEKFLADVIESGKSDEVIAYETAKEELEKSKRKAEAQKTVDAAAKYTRPLMTDAQYKIWRRNYNNINNEGGEGYIPELITVEQLAEAKKILAE